MHNLFRNIGSTEEDRMAGDVNLFLNDSDDLFNAEIEVMIAEHGFRNLGIAREALLMLIFKDSIILIVDRHRNAMFGKCYLFKKCVMMYT
jgi:hypothetical protein